MSTAEQSPLGRHAAYPEAYDPYLLHPIPRAAKRAELGINGKPPFYGVDIWNAYELSWLDVRGKPMVGVAELRVPADSPNIVESKSLKLYLNGFSQERLAGTPKLLAVLERDISAAVGAPVAIEITLASASSHAIRDLDGQLLDEQLVRIDHYGPPRPAFLTLASEDIFEETLVSRVFRSNCPVTGQPDWGTMQIRYRGRQIEHAGLLRYLVSFRNHSGFHEHCVEQIYMDLHQRCAPESLSVYARYTRRGGIDINPFRSSTQLSAGSQPSNRRGARQ